MPIGDTFPSEISEFQDPITGRARRQLTAGDGNDYHLYYQAYSITRDGRWLALYSERDRTTQLYRLDLHSGEIARLTDGRTPMSGWWPWNDMYTTGVYAFIACLNLVTGEVYYHVDDELRAVSLSTLEDRLIAKAPPAARPISQLSCAYDGSFVATVYAGEQDVSLAEASHREAAALGRTVYESTHYWRNVLHSRLHAVDLSTGESTELVEAQAALHNMCIASDNDTVLLVKPPEDRPGLLSVRRSAPGQSTVVSLPDEYGLICHFHATQDGWITFESNVREGHKGKWAGPGTYMGRMRPDGSELVAWWLGNQGYVHSGCDLEGRFMFAELHCGGAGHHLAAVAARHDGSAALIRLTGDLPPGGDQRHHAHPILTPDRRRILHTATGEDGFCHLYDVEVSDLTGA